MMSLMSRTFSVLNECQIIERKRLWNVMVTGFFHTNSRFQNEVSTKEIVRRHPFAEQKEKKKQSFLDVVNAYRRRTISDRALADFLLIAIKYMDEFGVSKDLEVYKALLDILPKGKYIPQNLYQKIMTHYPVQQYAVIDVLSKMEESGVLPDEEVEEMILNIFGENSLAIKKFWRMKYWMGKFAHLNPFKPPMPLPTDPRVISKFAMWKISTVDVLSEITEFQTKDVEDSIEDTWIISVMSRTQVELLRLHDIKKPLYIEGPFNVWVSNQCIDYFVLKGDPIKREVVEKDTDDTSKILIPFWEEPDYGMPITIHEQEEGVYFAMCATGTSSKDSLLSWIRCLQKTNPNLKDIPIVFKLKSSTGELPLLHFQETKLSEETPEVKVLDKR